MIYIVFEKMFVQYIILSLAVFEAATVEFTDTFELSYKYKKELYIFEVHLLFKC